MSSAALDWLPYVDAPITDSKRAAAQSLVDAELEGSAATREDNAQHPRMNPPLELTPTSLGQDLLSRASRGEKLSAIDMTRYESGALDPPTTTSSDQSDPEQLQHWKDAANRAATLYSYLTLRDQHLALLESFGKNAWLMGNDAAEGELKALERTLAETKDQLEEVEQQRRLHQESSKGEIDALQAEWRKRLVGKTKTEIATAELREEIEMLKNK